MTLVEIREQFIRQSGRYDLVVDIDDWADNGADFYIKAGQRWLDTTFTIGRSEATYYANVSANGWYAIIPSCRVIHHVWVSKTTNVRWEVERIELQTLRDYFPGAIAEQDPGEVEFYAPLWLRTVPEMVDNITIDDLGAQSYVVAGDIFAFNGLIFAPPTEEQIRLEVWGSFYQATLSADSDKNFWSEQVPMALILAACRALEQSYRNKAGIEDFESTIKSELLGLEMDLADSESTGISQMEG